MAESLEAQVESLIEEARKLTRATKNRIRLFAAVILFTLLAMAGFGFAAIRAQSAATQAHKAIVASCEAANDFRRQDLKRWLDILNLAQQSPPPKGETAQEARQRRARTRQFRSHIIQADKLRVCKT